VFVNLLVTKAGPFSFQVLLHKDGRIIFSYKQVILHLSSRYGYINASFVSCQVYSDMLHFMWYMLCN